MFEKCITQEDPNKFVPYYATLEIFINITEMYVFCQTKQKKKVKNSNATILEESR